MSFLGIWTEVILRVVTRSLHMISAMIMLTILIFDCFFQFEKNLNLQENPTYKKLVNGTGMAMIGSGIIMTALMRRSDALPTQNKWLAYFPPKFFMSLLLTPISDKIALVLVGHRREVDDDDHSRFMFDLSTDWKQTIRMFRLGLMLMLYLYSAYIR